MNMKKLDELIASNTRLAELLGKKAEPEKKTHPIVWILAIVGAVAAIAAIAYAVFRYLNPEYFEDYDFEDEYEEDFEDDDTEDKFVIVDEEEAEEASEE